VCTEAKSVMGAEAADFFFYWRHSEVLADDSVWHVPGCIHNQTQDFRLKAPVSLGSWRYTYKNIPEDDLQIYKNVIKIVVVLDKIIKLGRDGESFERPLSVETKVHIHKAHITDKLLNTQCVVIYTTYMWNKKKQYCLKKNITKSGCSRDTA
jgi:hypothetical protein